MLVKFISLMGGTSMDLLTHLRRRHSRRDILKSGAVAMLPLAARSGNSSLLDQHPMTANGGTDPYPIPWLDKNGSHNQPAGANLEPSHIYHFKGRVARYSTFTGTGTDNQGVERDLQLCRPWPRLSAARSYPPADRRIERHDCPVGQPVNQQLNKRLGRHQEDVRFPEGVT